MNERDNINVTHTVIGFQLDDLGYMGVNPPVKMVSDGNGNPVYKDRDSGRFLSPGRAIERLYDTKPGNFPSNEL